MEVGAYARHANLNYAIIPVDCPEHDKHLGSMLNTGFLLTINYIYNKYLPLSKNEPFSSDSYLLFLFFVTPPYILLPSFPSYILE
jgi:hypothetical protein